jgi:HD-like signal output (HDOD) protein
MRNVRFFFRDKGSSTMDERLSRLDRVISRIGDLPALPSVVSEALSITEDPSSAMSQISETIQRDPDLTAKILKVSNSPYYGMKQYVGTLKLALVILGVREIRNIVLGVSIFESLSDGHLDAMLAQNFWDHSVRVGGISKKLGAALGLGLQGEDFISGLLHDMGKMALLRQLGPVYMRVLKASGGFSEPLCMMENEKFGFDHADAAAALASCWNLPKTLEDALWCHHPGPERQIANAKDPRLAALVRIANRASREDFVISNGQPGPSCLEEEAWGVLGSARAPGDSEGRHELLKRFVSEFDEPPPDEA